LQSLSHNFLSTNIPKARALVFPTLDNDTYALVAGFFHICSDITGAANELYNAFSVKVTDWKKFQILVKCFKNERFVGNTGGYKHSKIVRHLVLLLFYCNLLESVMSHGKCQ
jgi:hypothetical protein